MPWQFDSWILIPSITTSQSTTSYRRIARSTLRSLPSLPFPLLLKDFPNLVMRSACALLIALVAWCTPVIAMEHEVSTCAELASVDGTTATTITITSSSIECDSYTRFVVRNTLVVKATATEVTFKNFAFKVYEALTVEPNVVFQDVVNEVSYLPNLKLDHSSDFNYRDSCFRGSWYMPTK